MLDELQLTYTSYNGQNLNSPAVSVIRGSTVLLILLQWLLLVPKPLQAFNAIYLSAIINFPPDRNAQPTVTLNEPPLLQRRTLHDKKYGDAIFWTGGWGRHWSSKFSLERPRHVPLFHVSPSFNNCPCAWCATVSSSVYSDSDVFRRQIYKIHISHSLLVSYHNMSLKIYLGLSICLFYVFHMHPIYCPTLCVCTLALLLWATRWSSALINKSCCCCGGDAGSSRWPCGLRCWYEATQLLVSRIRIPLKA
jgi:hypothetical protein